MKRFIWLLLLLVGLVLFLNVPVYAANFEGVEIDIKEVEAQIKSRTNMSAADRSLFIGWTDDQIRDFIEAISLVQKDMEVTQLTIDRFGYNAEANPVARQIFASGIEPESILLADALASYLIINELTPAQRGIVLFLFRAIEVYMIDTHRPYGNVPSSRQQTMMTVLRIRF